MGGVFLFVQACESGGGRQSRCTTMVWCDGAFLHKCRCTIPPTHCSAVLALGTHSKAHCSPWGQGCGDRECLLLDLRSALYRIPASSGQALTSNPLQTSERYLIWVAFFLFVQACESGGGRRQSRCTTMVWCDGAFLHKCRCTIPPNHCFAVLALGTRSKAPCSPLAQGCGDRERLLLDLRSALYRIPASSGVIACFFADDAYVDRRVFQWKYSL